jgi:hypothetical protein
MAVFPEKVACGKLFKKIYYYYINKFVYDLKFVNTILIQFINTIY